MNSPRTYVSSSSTCTTVPRLTGSSPSPVSQNKSNRLYQDRQPRQESQHLRPGRPERADRLVGTLATKGLTNSLQRSRPETRPTADRHARHVGIHATARTHLAQMSSYYYQTRRAHEP